MKFVLKMTNLCIANAELIANAQDGEGGQAEAAGGVSTNLGLFCGLFGSIFMMRAG